MSDIFLSYSRKDRAIAAALAEILPSEGWTIYWDRQLRAGEIFDEVLEREVTAARCVVVLWSTNSVASQWVRNEADVGACRNALISVLIENVTVPLAFRRVQAADLIGWKGDASDSRLTELLQAISHFLEGSPRTAAAVAVGDGAALTRAEPLPVRFEPATMQAVERHLAEHVGPVAHSLVKASAARCVDLPGLYQDLAQHVPSSGRESFLSRRQNVVANLAVAELIPTSMPSYGQQPSAEWLAELKEDLAMYLGPIARIVVHRAVPQASSLEDLVDRVSREIPNERDRLVFLKHWHR